MPLSSPLNPWGTQDGPEVGIMHPLPVSPGRAESLPGGLVESLRRNHSPSLGLLSTQMLMQGLASTLPTAPEAMAGDWKFQNADHFSRSGLQGESCVQ